MAKLSFKLVAAPTFKAKVKIPVAGGESVEVEFEFRHRTKDDLMQWVQNTDREDVETIMQCAVAWELEDAFDVPSVTLLTQNYSGSAIAVFKVYIKELLASREGN